jgi:hypothetical protein
LNSEKILENTEENCEMIWKIWMKYEFNLLFLHIFHIFSLFNLPFFHIFPIFSLFHLLFFHIVHILSLFDLLFFHIFQQQPYTPQSSSSHAHPRTAAAIALKFHPKHEKQKQNETHYENITGCWVPAVFFQVFRPELT